MANERPISEPFIVDVETLSQQFEEFVDRASEGHEIVITKEDKPFAKLVPLQASVRE